MIYNYMHACLVHRTGENSVEQLNCCIGHRDLIKDGEESLHVPS